jgi:hypothetical protein
LLWTDPYPGIPVNPEAGSVSTFYVLPSRPQLGERFARFLQSLFPDLEWDSTTWGELADTLTAAVVQQPDVFVVHQEELPPDGTLVELLADGFGAARGDRVIEITRGARPEDFTFQHWSIAED